MNQIVLLSTKLNSRIAQELNDTEKDVRSELSLFDKIKSANQKNSTCKVIRDAIENKKKSFDEMLLKKFESIEDILLFKKKL
jgi:non-homologous end joining protein Ku